MSDFAIDPELEANYEALRESREWDHETLAANLESRDPALAAHFRSKAQPEKPKARKASRQQEA